MKIAIVAMTVVIGLTSSAFVSACVSGTASDNFKTSGDTNRTTKVYTIQKNGQIKTVTGVKGGEFPLKTADPDWHEYDGSDREWVGDPQTWEQLEQIVVGAFKTECDANLPENLDRTEEFKKDLEKYFSPDSGELQKRQYILENEAKIVPTGAVTCSGITKIDFKGISVQDDEATIIVDIWRKLQGRAIRENTPDGARQHTLTLKLENERWLITKDLSALIPGSYMP